MDAQLIPHPPQCGCKTLCTYRVFCKTCHASKILKLPNSLPLEEIAKSSRCGFCESVGSKAKIEVSIISQVSLVRR